MISRSAITSPQSGKIEPEVPKLALQLSTGVHEVAGFGRDLGTCNPASLEIINPIGAVRRPTIGIPSN